MCIRDRLRLYPDEVETPPARFNMSRYCVGPAPHRPPDKVGLIVAHGGAGQAAGYEQWRYGELAQAVGACARGLLDAGIRPGERLVLRLPGQSTYPLLFFGAIAAGIVAVPTSSPVSYTHLSASSGLSWSRP